MSQKGLQSPIALPSVSSVLRRIWPKGTRKHVARAADVSLETAKNWLDGTGCPRADQVLEMALRDAKARAAFKAVLEEIDYAERRLAEMARYGVFSPRRDVGQARPVAQPVGKLARTPATSA